jgi:uncharacterized protein
MQPAPAKPALIVRIIRFPVTRIVLALFFTLAPSIALSAGAGALGVSDPLLSSVFAVIGALLGYVLYVRLIERRPLDELDPREAWQLAVGFVGGLLLFSIVVAILWLLGAYSVTGTNPIGVALAALPIGLLPGFIEELIFRGILHRIIESALGTWLSLFITSLFFGFAHIANPGATIGSATAIALEAGLMLGIAYTATRRLWVPIGLHAAWNFAQGGVYGIAVSGVQVDGLLRGQLSGSELISGGAFGAEASIVAVLVCLALFALLLARARRSGRMIVPFWQRRASAA